MAIKGEDNNLLCGCYLTGYFPLTKSIPEPSEMCSMGISVPNAQLHFVSWLRKAAQKPGQPC